jgi:hypothetical protein
MVKRVIFMVAILKVGRIIGDPVLGRLITE